MKKTLANWIFAHPFLVYMAGVLFITTTASALFIQWLVWLDISPILVVIMALLSILPIHDTAEIAICKVIQLFFKPHLLPEMKFPEGIPDEFRTLIVYASLLVNKEAFARTLECMEYTHIANKDKNLPVAILTHFKDSHQEGVSEEESDLLNFAVASLESLNKKHGQGQFYLFHRDRKWNTVSLKWEGWERKRGGVEELNKWLLRKNEYRDCGPGKAFGKIAGDIDALGQVSKVILLDSDNKLPSGSAARLVAKAAHPLNQPVVSDADEIVVRGYGVLQPFPIPSKESCKRSVFARIEGWNRRPGGPQHFILQTLQELFREGTYIGKGLYDVTTHEKVLSNRFPDNQLLSHDKVESGFLRTAFVPDILVLEEALDNFLVGMNQIARWLRGDKQTLPWVLPRIPDRKRERVKNPLSLFSRWNLIWPIKKQISIPSLVSFCIVGWFVPELASKWCSLILVVVISFPYIIVPLNLRSPLSSLVGIIRGAASTVVYVAFSLHRAILILTAIVRISLQFPERNYVRDMLKRMKGLGNLGILRKLAMTLRILAKSVLRRPNIDWVTASEVKRQKKIYSLPGIYAAMLPSILICLALGVGCFLFVERLSYVLPVLGLWFAAPLIVCLTSKNTSG